MGWLLSAGPTGLQEAPVMRIGSATSVPGWSFSASSRTNTVAGKVWQSVLTHLTEQHDNLEQEEKS